MEENLQALMEEFGLIEDGDVSIDPNNLPGERSQLPRDIPQPGAIRFRTPTDMRACIGKYDTLKGQRMQLQFMDDHSLTNVASGAPVRYNINDNEQELKDNAGYTSEFVRFLKGLGYTGVLGNKADRLQAALSLGTREFLADVSWSTSCNPKKPAYRDGAKTDESGCGRQWGMEARKFPKRDGTQGESFKIPQDADGRWQQKFSCVCGASLNAFLRLGNYRK